MVCDQVSSEVLRSIDQAGDDCPAKISAFDKVKHSRVATKMGFDFDSTLHHGESFIAFFFGVVAETFDGAHGFFFAAAAD